MLALLDPSPPQPLALLHPSPPSATSRMASHPHMAQMDACARDPFYHISKDKSYVTYPDLQDTADRLRAIREVSAALRKGTRSAWCGAPPASGDAVGP